MSDKLRDSTKIINTVKVQYEKLLSDKTSIAAVGNERNEDLLRDIHDLKAKVNSANDTREGLQNDIQSSTLELQTTKRELETFKRDFET